MLINTIRSFERINIGDKVGKKEGKVYRWVDGQQGFKLFCGGVSCIFEFEAYHFIGTVGGGIGDDDGQRKEAVPSLSMSRPTQLSESESGIFSPVSIENIGKPTSEVMSCMPQDHEQDVHQTDSTPSAVHVKSHVEIARVPAQQLSQFPSSSGGDRESERACAATPNVVVRATPANSGIPHASPHASTWPRVGTGVGGNTSRRADKNRGPGTHSVHCNTSNSGRVTLL